MKKKIKIGLVGLGRISGHHTRAILKNKNLEIAAACDLKKELRDQYKDKTGIRVYSNYDQMLKQEKKISKLNIVFLYIFIIFLYSLLEDKFKGFIN